MTIHRRVSSVTAMDGQVVTQPEGNNCSVGVEVAGTSAAIRLGEGMIQPL